MSSIVDQSLLELFEGPSRARRGPPEKLYNKARRVVDRVTEVMVKISGNAKGADHVKAHMSYITRNGQVEMETETGEIIEGKAAVKAVQQEWTADNGWRSKNTRDTTNIVLSMPKGTNATKLKDAVRAFAKKQFSENYQYVFALHEDSDNPHVHLCVKSLGHKGKRFHVKRGEPQLWRESFAKELRQRGIEAEASSRASRGIVMKSVKQVLKHIFQREGTCRVKESQWDDIIHPEKAELRQIFTSDSPAASPKPWEEKIRKKISRVRCLWENISEELRSDPNDDEEDLSNKIQEFISSMPRPFTRAHIAGEMLAKQRSAAREDKRRQQLQEHAGREQLNQPDAAWARVRQQARRQRSWEDEDEDER